MRIALLGVGISIAVYTTGVLSWVALVRRGWRRIDGELPAELERLRDEAHGWQLRSQLSFPSPRAMAWTILAALVLAGLWAAEFGLLFEVLYVVALSAWWSAAHVDAVRTEARAQRESYGLAKSDLNALHSGAALNASAFLITCGFLGAVCFIGGMLAEIH